MTREEVILRGELAAFILSDATIMSFFEEMKAATLQAIGHTEPDDVQTRSDLYFRHRGINDVIDHMQSYRAMAHEALEQDASDQKELTSNGEDVFEMQDYEE